MKRIIFGIFAHPDDETFGPSATFLKEVQEGADLHLISVTAGQHGINKKAIADLGETRLQEWQAAGQAMGARTLQALDYEDGCLCNKDYQNVLHDVEQAIQAVVATYHEPAQLQLVTFGPKGLTGHLDHIAVSFIVTKLFYELPDILPSTIECQELAYYCFSKAQAPKPNMKYFVFMPAGDEKTFLNRTVEVGPFLPQKYAMMRMHQSQRKDAEALIKKGDEFHRYDHFHVITRQP
jgi:LmbE family N-acetylglucosaminyl deacetylase